MRKPMLEWRDQGDIHVAELRDERTGFCMGLLMVSWSEDARTYSWRVTDPDSRGPSGSERVLDHAKVVAEATLFDLLDDAVHRLGGTVERDAEVMGDG